MKPGPRPFFVVERLTGLLKHSGECLSAEEVSEVLDCAGHASQTKCQGGQWASSHVKSAQ